MEYRMRTSGVLLPIFSLPSAYGIGCFSREAYQFVDRLKKAGQTYWQILPMGPTGYGNSPYQSFSTFAGNPLFIDLQELIECGYLTEKECGIVDFGKNPEKIDYEKVKAGKKMLLQTAWKRSGIAKNADFQCFVEENAFWLEDYCLYMAVKQNCNDACWKDWPAEIRNREPEALQTCSKLYRDEIEFYAFEQYLFYRQWGRLKKYANKKGIRIVGDLPIYVAFDSSDAWAEPRLFQFDAQNEPIAVAGCPPDAFSATGQLWGNPLYDWDYHRQTDYRWWMKRLESCFRMYDVVRIDHFRAFDEYYAIPAGDPTAEFGTWKPGPGYEFFEKMHKELGERPVIAEDLGFLTPSVLELVEKCGFPGMKILQFAFDSDGQSSYLPHRYTRNCVVYTGTHDNDTTLGWYHKLERKDRDFCHRYLQLRDRKPEEIVWELIRTAQASVADTCILPMQDWLCLDTYARINLPSTVGNNWMWRMKKKAFTVRLAEQMGSMSQLYGRTPAGYRKKRHIISE